MFKEKNNFSDALTAMKSGATIYRAIEFPEKYCKRTCIVEGKEIYDIYSIKNKNRYNIVFSSEDVLAEDWIIELQK